jgi:PAS domain-containing protein
MNVSHDFRDLGPIPVDIYTLFTIYGLLCIAGGISLTFAVHRMSRAAQLWVGALYCTGIGAVLTSHRAALGHDIGYTFATTTFFVGSLLMCIGLLAFEDKPRRWRDIAKLGAAAAAVHLLAGILLSRLDGQHLQGLHVYASLAATSFWGAALAGRIASERGYRSGRLLQFTFLVVGLLWLLRIYMKLSGHGLSAFDPVTLNVVIFTAHVIFGIARWFSFAAMESERVIRNARSAAERIRQQAEELAERNASMASAMLVAPAACVVTDRIGRVVYLNDEGKRFFGAAGHDFIGRELARAFIGVDPKAQLDDGRTHLLFMKPYREGQSHLLEVRSQTFKGDARSMQRVLVVRQVLGDRDSALQVVRNTPIAPSRVLLACDMDGMVRATRFRLESFDATVQQSLEATRNVWQLLEAAAPGDRTLQRAKARATSGATASVLLRSPTGLTYDVSFSRLAIAEANPPVMLADIRLVQSGLLHAARGLLGGRPRTGTAADPEDVAKANIPAFIRQP